MEFMEFLQTSKNTVPVDWDAAEQALAFPLHNQVKDFYSRGYGTVRGRLNLQEEKMRIKTGNPRNDTWFSENECKGAISFEFSLLESGKASTEKIVNAFHAWTGGHDFGRRALLGMLHMNMGSILILLNNNTGDIEWMDCEYGYFDVYDENPNGILAHSVDALLEKFSQSLLG